MATLTPLSASLAAGNPAADTPAVGGDVFDPGNASVVFIHVRNASGGALTVKIDDPTTPTPEGYTGFDPDYTRSVGAGAEALIALRSPSRWRNPTTGNVSLTYPDGVTGLTIKVYI